MQQTNDNVKPTNEDNANDEKVKKSNDAKKKRPDLSQSRRLINARQMSKLAKNDQPVFLAIVRENGQVPQERKSNKRSSSCAARFAAAHGRSEIYKRSINKTQGPKKDIITTAEREQQVLDSVPRCHQE